jgi:hypothetical protein
MVSSNLVARRKFVLNKHQLTKTGLKNIVAFGFLYGVVPWVDRVGYVNCFGTMAGIFAGVVGIGAVLLILYGAKTRHATAKWQVILE